MFGPAAARAGDFVEVLRGGTGGIAFKVMATGPVARRELNSIQKYISLMMDEISDPEVEASSAAPASSEGSNQES